MSNYLATITIYKDGLVERTTQMHLKNVVIPDITSARAAIMLQIAKDDFDYTDRELESFVITMFCKVDSGKRKVI